MHVGAGVTATIDAAAAAPACDLLILMDVTGSMYAWLEEAKTKATGIVRDIEDATRSHVRLGFVGYRDYVDGDGRIVVSRISSKRKGFLAVVGGINAEGGGDIPEDVAGGLRMCGRGGDVGWASPVKHIVHFGDAPPHGRAYHTCVRACVCLSAEAVGGGLGVGGQ